MDLLQYLTCFNLTLWLDCSDFNSVILANKKPISYIALDQLHFGRENQEASVASCPYEATEKDS